MSTYQHPNLDPNLMGVQNSMEYNAAGEPALRVIANLNGWGIQVSNGDIEGVSYIEKFGRSSDIPNGDTVTLWDGNTVYDYVDTATTVTVTSNNSDDAPGGDGAHNVEIQGLDADYNVVLEDVNLGATSTTEFLRVFRVRVKHSGSHGTNWGDITVAGGGKTLAIIDGGPNNGPGVGQTFMCVYTVPAGKTAYLTQWAVSSGKQNADTLAKFMSRPFDNGSWNTKDIVEIQSNNYIKDYKVPLKFDEKTDIEVRAFSGTGSTAASTFNLILIDNPVEE
jgi:hypothetical protein